MKYIPNGATRLLGSALLYGQKNAPAILFGTGIVGVVATTVLASKATLHLDEVLEESHENLVRVKNATHPGYTETKRKQDLAKIYTMNTIAVGRLYAPALVVGTISIACLTRSHQILTTRNAALTTAYNGLMTAFQSYRARVVDDLGEDKDREYLYGVDQRTIVEDTDKGPKKKQLKTYGRSVSPYAVEFNRTNNNWNTEPTYSLQFIRGVQQYLTDLLNARGHVMLNEAYDALGFPHTPAGTQVGWIRTKDGGVDGVVDFGLFRDDKMLEMHEFMTGRDGSLMIDFNVDGVIWEKVGKQKPMFPIRRHS